uniref:MORF/ORRM1/DAG-like MORF domain-containing protein n=1 Tax=Leersia perrieri TaxID=77586 RepID=A0A0D9XFG9_9ORYZ
MASASRFLLISRLPAAAASTRLIRPLAAAAGSLLPAALRSPSAAAAPRSSARCFATQPVTSSLRDSSPNWSNRPPKETILLDGCDFEHWLVVMDPPPGNPGDPDITRDEIIDSYIKTLAQIVGSEEEARQKIYSVSTRHYFAFGALVSEELSYKLKELPKVRWVLPDSYLDVKNKDYGGEPFINGEAVPYDPKYHEEWVRNNSRANERTRRNDRPRNYDRSRNFERRRENMQNFQNRDGQGFNSPPPPGQGPVPPRDAPPMHHGQGPPPPPPNAGGPCYQPHVANPQAGYTNYQQGGAPSYPGGNPGYQGGQRYTGPPPPSAYQGNNPGYQGGGPGYQGGNPPSYQGGNPPSYQGGNPSYGGGAQDYQGQGGNPSYQQGGNNYSGGAPAYGDGPGRNYQ